MVLDRERRAQRALELEALPFGMATAALAGISRQQILNFRPVEFVRASRAADLVRS
jgi:hypothetical protein